MVPFSLESSLSGVMGTVNEAQIIWYEKEFKLPENWKDKKILLHFGAVDWKCTLYINDAKIGEHEGGYSPFYFDITNRLNKEGKNKIVLRVYDPTNYGYQPVGKQTKNPGSIWYTPISGIWQTVWLEPVNEDFIDKLEINNNFDNKQIKVTFKLNSNKNLPIKVTLIYDNKEIEKTENTANKEITIQIPDKDFHGWSPSEPNLYYLKADLFSESGDLLDSIQSYTAVRKIESLPGLNGYKRIFLNTENHEIRAPHPPDQGLQKWRGLLFYGGPYFVVYGNKPIFNMGTLDQGYWPDGLYTPPSEEAMIYDIQKLKDLGFNTIRKHIKIEPFRYYYACDKIGMLVWQDMPSGNIGGNQWDSHSIGGGTDVKRTQASKDNYYKEWGEIIDTINLVAIPP